MDWDGMGGGGGVDLIPCEEIGKVMTACDFGVVK
jgi:hypothetical protein